MSCFSFCGGEQTISFLFDFLLRVCKKLKYFFGNSLQVNLDLNKIMTTVMLSAFNHMPFTMVAEDTWRIADEMLEADWDGETDMEEEIEDDAETVICYDCAIDVQVFHLWNNVVREFVNTFGKFIK